jgi:hypothetical protein
MKKTLILTWVVFLLALLGVVLWSRHYARNEAARAVAEQEQEEFVFWKAKLLPLYEAMDVAHAQDPTTKEELFAPLTKLGTLVAE